MQFAYYLLVNEKSIEPFSRTLSRAFLCFYVRYANDKSIVISNVFYGLPSTHRLTYVDTCNAWHHLEIRAERSLTSERMKQRLCTCNNNDENRPRSGIKIKRHRSIKLAVIDAADESSWCFTLRLFEDLHRIEKKKRKKLSKYQRKDKRHVTFYRTAVFELNR